MWQHQSPPPRQFLVAICPEEEGGFSVFALNYPEVVSQGDTIEEAKSNIAEAFVAVVESKEARGQHAEFSARPVEIPNDCERCWISINGLSCLS
jgi:predicted RNase H-like HicB family nuclease